MEIARVAKFHKISFKQFEQDFMAAQIGSDCDIKAVYDNIKLPVRATKDSAGYDFFMPTELSLAAGDGTLVPTGIRAKIARGWVLKLYPRSGLGFKFRLSLDNTVGIIDGDYFNAENEGHIMIKLTNCGAKPLSLAAGAGFAQGLFIPFGITEDDEAEGARTGGFGSTGN